MVFMFVCTTVETMRHVGLNNFNLMCSYLGSNGASSRHSLHKRESSKEWVRFGGTHQVAVVVCADHV